MEVKPDALESTKKISTKPEEVEEKTKKDDVMTSKDQEITIIKGNLKIMDGLKQAKTRDHDDQSPKTSKSSPSSSYVMKIKLGNYKNLIPRPETTKKMENLHKNEKSMNLKPNKEESDVQNMKKKIWDCESALYDSFELNSFNRQLDSAIISSARSMSMPHFPPPPPSEIVSSSSSTPSSSLFTKKQSSNKISRSLQKLIKSMFGHKQSKSNTRLKASNNGVVDMDKYYVVFDKTGSLTTIPESRESTELVSSKVNSLVRKTVSERFPPSRLVGITS